MSNFPNQKIIVSRYGPSSCFKPGMKNTSRTKTPPTAVTIELSGEKAVRLRDIAILAAFCFFLLFFALGELPFFTRGEPREGLVVWEMYSSGNWILPAVNGDYIPFKPP